MKRVIYDSFLGTGGGVFFLESNSCRMFLETATVALSDVAAAASKAASLRLSMPMTTSLLQGCQMAKFDPFLSLDCARVEGVGAQSKERKGLLNFAA